MKGIPKALQKLVIVREWNDFDAVEKAVKKNAGAIAAIITEPVMANSSVIPPQEGYLKFLKELCDKNDIVLIFDEVKTGFRVAKGVPKNCLGHSRT
jgi:glutamate-1-semialdehyde 2,1-aminomutase